MKAIRMSDLRTGRFYPSGNIPVTHFFYRLSRPKGRCTAGRIMSIKISATFRVVRRVVRQPPVPPPPPPQKKSKRIGKPALITCFDFTEFRNKWWKKKHSCRISSNYFGFSFLRVVPHSQFNVLLTVHHAMILGNYPT